MCWNVWYERLVGCTVYTLHCTGQYAVYRTAAKRWSRHACAFPTCLSALIDWLFDCTIIITLADLLKGNAAAILTKVHRLEQQSYRTVACAAGTMAVLYNTYTVHNTRYTYSHLYKLINPAGLYNSVQSQESWEFL